MRASALMIYRGRSTVIFDQVSRQILMVQHEMVIAKNPVAGTEATYGNPVTRGFTIATRSRQVQAPSSCARTLWLSNS